MTKLRLWLKALRPPTLFASLSPVLVGGAYGLLSGWSGQNLRILVVCFLTAGLLQMGANVVNDVKDAVSGVDHAGRRGPERLALSGALSLEELSLGYKVIFALGCLGVLWLSLNTGPLVAITGVFSILVAYAYTGGPYPLAYHGWGELSAASFFGPIATAGTAYALTGTWSWDCALVGLLGPGLFATTMMFINNLRDSESDKIAGKFTLAQSLGNLRSGVFIAIVLLHIAWLSFIHVGLTKESWFPSILFTALGLVSVWIFIRPELYSLDPMRMTKALARVAISMAVYGVAYMSLLLS